MRRGNVRGRGGKPTGMAHRSLFPVTLVALVFAGSLALPAGFQEPAPPASSSYLGQQPPGAKATLFAPGVVSTALFERDLAVTPDGREIYWTVTMPGSNLVTTVTSRLANGTWTSPEVVPQMTDPDTMFIEPAISPDGRRFFFTLAKPSPRGRIASAAIWAMDRVGEGWGKAYDLGAPVNGEGKRFFPSITRNGTLYFTREAGTAADGIYRAKLAAGRYAEPERLPVQVNSGSARYNAFVDRDERFLIVPMEGRPDSRGGVDYYAVFRNPDDTWRDPINLGEEVNTPGSGEYSPYISPDGRYFFFMSSRIPDTARPSSLTAAFFRGLLQRPQNGSADIYWIDAGFIEKLRK